MDMEMITKGENLKADPGFAICIKTDDRDLLTPRMIYEVLPDQKAAESNCVRVIDNEGEDYLYPESYFILVDLPPEAKQALSEKDGRAR